MPELGRNAFLMVLLGLMVVSTVTYSTYATTATVTSKNYNARYGVVINDYFETSSLATGSTPTVNTAMIPPAGSGSSSLTAGASGNLWSTQFTSAATIPAGQFTLDISATSTPALDGSASKSFSGNSGAVTLTTTNAGDVIYVAVSTASNPTVSVSDAAALTWIARATSSNGATGLVATFYAISPSSLTRDSITVALSASQKFAAIAFGISGADTSSPFDPSAGVPATASGTSNAPAVSLTTTVANDFVIGAAFASGGPKVTAGPAFSSIASVNSGGNGGDTDMAEYENGVPSGAQTVSFSLSQSKAWAIIGDAVVPATSMTLSVYTTDSAGTVASTLISNSAISIPASAGSAVARVSIVGGSVPVGGYIEVVLTASAQPCTVYWGPGQQSSAQLQMHLLS